MKQLPLLLLFLYGFSLTMHAEDKPLVLFLTGDEEYRSEESMPMIAKILEKNFEVETDVGFSVNEEGFIDPLAVDTVTKMEDLEKADLLVLFYRFRNPPRETFEHFLNYLRTGKPIVAFRTSTHAFRFTNESGLGDWGFQDDPTRKNSFGGGDQIRKILGQKWITHHGHFDDGEKPLTSVELEKPDHPILRGVKPFQAFSWLYHVQGGGDTLAGDPVILLKGTALKSNKIEKGETDRYPLTNPIAWTKSYSFAGGEEGRVFTTTLGHPYDFRDENMRRLALQGILWALGKDDWIPEEGVNADVIGTYEPNNSGNGKDKYKAGLKPEDVTGG